MKNKILPFILLFVLLLVACAGEKTPATEAAETVVVTEAVVIASPTIILDPCSESALPDEVQKVNDLMREFDDYSKLASSTPQNQLVQVIPSLQEIRRRAESQETPECLATLKKLQLAHMNTVIEILMVFMSNPEAEGVNQGIAQARDLHVQYDVEIARLLGLTLVAPPAVTDATAESTVTP